MQEIEFPVMVAQEPPLKRALGLALGRLLALTAPRRYAELARGDIGERISGRDRLMLKALVAHHERHGTLDALAPLHQWLWREGQALHFHEQAQARFEPWWRAHHSAILQPLQEAVRAQGQMAALCEIGCGSGLVLADVAKRLQGVGRFIGLDLSPAQTERNRLTWRERPELRFEAGDACVWIPQHAAPGWIYFTNAGVLEYLSETQLTTLLSTIRQRLAPALLAIVEPMAPDFDLERETRARAYGPERTLSHAYPALLRQCGWTEVWRTEQRVSGQRFVLLVAKVV